MRVPLFVSAIVIALGLAAVQPADAAFGYAIGDGGSSLVSFSTDTPGMTTRVGSFQPGLFLDAIDFRPATGELYGYSSLANSYYTVNLTTGSLTKVSAASAGPGANTFQLGMDFNPTIDRLRVLTDSTQNIVYNPDTGTTVAVTNLAYGTGDTNFGIVPLVIDNAYTNSVANATTTTQYALDYGTHSLVTVANNAGTLATVATITLNGTELNFGSLNDAVYAGFDINTSPLGVNTAYALLKVNGTTGLYTIDLTNGRATSLGAFGTGVGDIYSLAIVPSAVPEPASVILVGLGFGGMGLVALRRRSSRNDA